MGYLTPVLIRNDSIHRIKDDPYFVEKLSGDHSEDHEIYARSYKKTWVDKILSLVGLYRIPKYSAWKSSSSCAQVLKSEHADTPRVLVVWGNTWMDLSAEYYKNVDISWGGDNPTLSKVGEVNALRANMDYYEKCVRIAGDFHTKGKTLVRLMKQKKTNG